MHRLDDFPPHRGRRHLAMNAKTTVDIMLTGNMWQIAATDTAPALSDYSESALAAKVFELRPECDVVSVLDGAGRLVRTIHRNAV